MKYHTSSNTRVDTDKETKERYKPPSTLTQATPPTAEKRAKYTKNQKNQCKNAAVAITQELNMAHPERHIGTMSEHRHIRQQEWNPLQITLK